MARVVPCGNYRVSNKTCPTQIVGHDLLDTLYIVSVSKVQTVLKMKQLSGYYSNYYSETHFHGDLVATECRAK